ncbi:hypothetical protein Hamer_G027505 [Homarus americanus]|uniref:Uncharacterized protein n=1 Tax=Homarus americanus TaxID=6706 RepID=A0A8J5N550_HOMAM|nr:hypothetical protein Hamer_G028144 [Homarus americanus]KAG7173616.1 hypothetical protein Hamer_G027505 [Homarus americanus]
MVVVSEISFLAASAERSLKAPPPGVVDEAPRRHLPALPEVRDLMTSHWTSMMNTMLVILKMLLCNPAFSGNCKRDGVVTSRTGVKRKQGLRWHKLLRQRRYAAETIAHALNITFHVLPAVLAPDLMMTFHTEVNENEVYTTKTTEDAVETKGEKQGAKQASEAHTDYNCSNSGISSAWLCYTSCHQPHSSLTRSIASLNTQPKERNNAMQEQEMQQERDLKQKEKIDMNLNWLNPSFDRKEAEEQLKKDKHDRKRLNKIGKTNTSHNNELRNPYSTNWSKRAATMSPNINSLQVNLESHSRIVYGHGQTMNLNISQNPTDKSCKWAINARHPNRHDSHGRRQPDTFSTPVDPYGIINHTHKVQHTLRVANVLSAGLISDRLEATLCLISSQTSSPSPFRTGSPKTTHYP